MLGQPSADRKAKTVQPKSKDTRQEQQVGEEAIRISEYIEMLNSDDVENREMAAAKLGLFGVESIPALRPLKDAAVGDPMAAVRSAALLSLGALLEQISGVLDVHDAMRSLREMIEEESVQNRNRLDAAIETVARELKQSALTQERVLTENVANARDDKGVLFDPAICEPHRWTPNQPTRMDDTMASTSERTSDEFPITVENAAKQLGLSVETLEGWVATGMVRLESGTGDARETGLTSVDLQRLSQRKLYLVIQSLFEDSDEWLNMPNPWLGGRTPRELIGSDDEHLVIELLDGIKHGAVA